MADPGEWLFERVVVCIPSNIRRMHVQANSSNQAQQLRGAFLVPTSLPRTP